MDQRPHHFHAGWPHPQFQQRENFQLYPNTTGLYQRGRPCGFQTMNCKPIHFRRQSPPVKAKTRDLNSSTGSFFGTLHNRQTDFFSQPVTRKRQ
ncbi:MAG: hypothetical protein EBV45_11235 [Chloroflexi bacterium]|nr:hypothetical protein [Chloroflexota bacterium]